MAKNMDNNVGIKTSEPDNVYATQIWNEAIEAAALIVQPNPHVDEERRCEDIADQIRKLKK